jgi:hypothetical protein
MKIDVANGRSRAGNAPDFVASGFQLDAAGYR